MAAYDGIEDQNNSLRLQTSRAHPDVIGLWLASLALVADAFAPGHRYAFQGEKSDQEGRRAFNLRAQLLGLAGRGSKPALDLLLAGYYTEAFGLLRSMLDGWGRALYVRLRPREYGRWYEPETPLAAGEIAPAPPSWSEIEGVAGKDGDEADRRRAGEGLLRFRLLTIGVHPSGESITQIHDVERGLMLFDPQYREDLCRHGGNHAYFIHLALLDEIAQLQPQSDLWQQALSSLVKAWNPYRDAIEPVLVAEAEALAQERAAKAAARRAAKCKSQQGTS